MRSVRVVELTWAAGGGPCYVNAMGLEPHNVREPAELDLDTCLSARGVVALPWARLYVRETPDEIWQKIKAVNTP